MAVHKGQPTISADVDRGSVALRVPIDGRARTVRLDPGDAIALGNALCVRAFAIAPDLADQRTSADGVKMRPIGQGGAEVAFLTDKGPLIIGLSANLVIALSEAANAVLGERSAEGTA